MNAKEMFRELGYDCSLQSRHYYVGSGEMGCNDYIDYHQKNHSQIIFHIGFDLLYDEVAVYYEEDGKEGVTSATKEEMKAIFQQCRELGWL